MPSAYPRDQPACPVHHVNTRLSYNRLAISVSIVKYPVFHMVHMIEIVRQGKVDFPPQMIVSEDAEIDTGKFVGL